MAQTSLPSLFNASARLHFAVTPQAWQNQRAPLDFGLLPILLSTVLLGERTPFQTIAFRAGRSSRMSLHAHVSCGKF